MTTLLYTHPDCLAHDPGEHHPESPDRLRAVLAALAAEEFAGLERREAPRAALDVVALVHDRGYVDALLDAVPASGHAALDPDTVLSPRSGEGGMGDDRGGFS
jgi:acetoin utilization deacetylase AcuC-like enzyme